MNKDEVMAQLEAFGDERTKATFRKHGAREPYFGVKIGDLKKIQKKVKKDHELSLELYSTGNSDAMYLAGLIADETQMTREDLNRWVNEAYWYMISEYPVAWVASETDFGFELGLEWIKSEEERIAAAGWSTLASVAAVKTDDDLDIDKYRSLLDHIGAEIHNSPNRVRYVMNQFVISIGSYVEALHKHAIEEGEKIGKVEVDMGGTACKVPQIPQYIQKVADRGRIGVKRKEARC